MQYFLGFHEVCEEFSGLATSAFLIWFDMNRGN